MRVVNLRRPGVSIGLGSTVWVYRHGQRHDPPLDAGLAQFLAATFGNVRASEQPSYTGALDVVHLGEQAPMSTELSDAFIQRVQARRGWQSDARRSDHDL